ncbi:hypothetical protein KY290_001722 [Solanum tuberosum]|uniref:Uncharacterized protein n=1 Tax=Solanum tuberosum TaxID=4113 RepID=A0ABQ7WN21_SOLTU|nr:hypothetical protein KY284_001761 [Solanum tuberosum]KAH0782124.1 hypothetical protein KY290_001722 [Solanum tuberosum]
MGKDACLLICSNRTTEREVRKMPLTPLDCRFRVNLLDRTAIFGFRNGLLLERFWTGFRVLGFSGKRRRMSGTGVGSVWCELCAYVTGFLVHCWCMLL